MDSDESNAENEVIVNIIISRRPRMLRQRRNFFTFYDEVDFRWRFRMSKRAAWMMIELIRDKIQIQTIRNGATSPEEMFLIALRFFATGCVQRTGGDLGGVSKSTACRVIKTAKELQRSFYKIAKFPRAIAAMDCTHIKIISPGGDDAELYRNRKGFFSFNVQTLCDSDLNIMDIVARWPGSTHDATIFRNSRICNRFEANEFGNAVVVANSGYPCNKWIMTPLLNVNSPAEALYNESQIRTRNCVERSYGVWKKRFPILSLGIELNIREVERIIVATAVLHNVCNLNNEKTAPPLDVDDLNAVLNTKVSAPPISRTAQNDNIYQNQIIKNHFQTL